MESGKLKTAQFFGCACGNYPAARAYVSRSYVIGVGVHLYICGQKKLNHTLAIDVGAPLEKRFAISCYHDNVIKE